MISSATQNILNQMVPDGHFDGNADSIFKTIHQTLIHKTPNEVIGELVTILAARDASFDMGRIKPLLIDLLARDRHTGYFIHPSLEVIMYDLAAWRARQSDGAGQYYLIHGDFMNLSSVNDAIDRVPTNDMMAIICGIYKNELMTAVDGCLLYHRSMGDEMAFIAMGTTQDRLNAALKKAETTTQSFIKALGLNRLKHKKYAHLTGSGLITAMVDLNAGNNQRTMRQQLDSMITDIKQKGVATDKKVTGVDADFLHNSSSEKMVRRALKSYDRYKIELGKDTVMRAPPSIHALKQTLNGHAISWPRDDRIEFLRQHHDGTKMMMRADVFNLGGLNTVFGNEGADVVKDHIIRILYTIMEQRMASAKIFDCGGGIIDVVINIMDHPTILKTAMEIQQRIYDEILSKTVSDYAAVNDLPFDGAGDDLMACIPHPRLDMTGTGIVMATHAVREHRSLPEIIERVDKIANRNKMHGFAYLGYDKDHDVVGFKLNDEPQLQNLGPGGTQKGKHYLPYTNALKRHLTADELPDVFIRPIGQICEIIFGTDMQAVLGFKKAIRALQDVGVSNDDILKINTYDQMDTRLIAADLPPLSVVSTQNRPSVIKNGEDYFMTMTLAEKLENLPRDITPYILAIQAAFRTIKLMEPHGHHPPAQSRKILLDELIV